MRRLVTILFAALALSAAARQITPDEAATVASEFFNGTRPSRAAAADRITVTRALPAGAATSRAAADDTASPYYVYNADSSRGFVIISGDDRARKILGYSDRGSFSFTHLPPQLSAILSQYAAQIASLTTTAPDPSWTETFDASSTNQKLLNTALWNQDYPYNCKCPATSEHKLCVTGCTATAMAIVMKYHNWPESGYGSHSYATYDPNLPETVSCDFSKTTFQWDKMVNELNDDSSEAERTAVGELMYAAAISVNTTFGCGGSYAHVNDIVGALRDYFNYDQSCQIIARLNFSDTEYLDIIRSEIDASRPIIMGGHTVDQFTGHTWVVDGYDSENNYLHFNWGWGGYSNGFFALNATDEANQYPTNRNIIINIQPNKQALRPVVPYLESPASYNAMPEGVKGQGGLRLSTSSIQPGEKFDAMIKLVVQPPKSSYEYFLTLIDDSNDIKSSISLGLFESVSEGRVRHDLFFPNLSFDDITEIDPDWRIQLCARADGEDQPLIPLTGSIDAPSGFPLNAIKSDITSVEIVTDGLAQIRLTPTWVIDDAKYLRDGDVFSTIIGAQAMFIAEPIEKLDNHIITLLYNGDYEVNINSTPMSVWSADRNIIRGAFITKPGTSKLEIRYEPMPEPRELELTTPGTLETLISKEDARTLTHLSLSGKINAKDIWYITRNFQSLISLDLKKASIVESENESVPNYFGHPSPSHQPENYLPDTSFWGMNRLSQVILPESLEHIGYMVMYKCSIPSLEVPEKVKTIGGDFMSETPSIDLSRPASIYSKNPEPPFMPYNIMADTENFEKGILYVPVGSAEKYRDALTWKNFKTIREMSKLPDDVEISKNSLQIKIDDTAQLTAKLLPSEATEQRLVWTSDHESIATVDQSGLITAISEGEATISVRPEFGDCIAQCKVRVTSADSALDNIIADTDGCIDIYSINGTLLMHNCTREALTKLQSGVYVLRQGTKATKFVVR